MAAESSICGLTRSSLFAACSLLMAGVGSPLQAQVSPNGPEFQANTYTTSIQVRPSVALDDRGDFVVAWTSYGSDGSDQQMGSIQGQRYSPDGTALGAQFQVNSYVTGNQLRPVVAIDPLGNFAVVWASFGSSGTDAQLWSIQAQRYSASGTPLGAQFQVNTYTWMIQEEPAIAMDPFGRFVVAWKSTGSSSTDSYYAVLAQRFAADGSRLGGEFQVNTYTTGYQRRPAVVNDSQGNFVVVWESSGSGGTDTSGYSVHGQRFTANGTPLGAEFQVNTYTSMNQIYPSVASDELGNFMVVWQSQGSFGTDTSSSSIQARRYDSSGNPLGNQFQVNSYTTYWQEVPKVSASARGDFIVAWQSFQTSQSDPDESIQAQRYDANGNALGGEFTVNTYTLGTQNYPRIASDSLGDFVVVWQGFGSDGTDTDSSSIHGQRFDGLFRDDFESGGTSRWSATVP